MRDFEQIKSIFDFAKIDDFDSRIKIVDGNISYLDLSYCEIENLPSGVFDTFPKVKSINLSGNRLQSLNVSLFKENLQINALNLADNHLKFIENDIFLLTPQLSYLDVAQNDLKSLPLSISELGKLDLINLSYNPLPLGLAQIYSGKSRIEGIKSLLNEVRKTENIWLDGRTQELTKNPERSEMGKIDRQEMIEREAEELKQVAIIAEERRKQETPEQAARITEERRRQEPRASEEWRKQDARRQAIITEERRKQETRRQARITEERRRQETRQQALLAEERRRQETRDTEERRVTALLTNILKIIQQITPNIQVQLTRIVQLSSGRAEEVEILLKTLIANNPELGQYLEFEQVFIKKDLDVSNELVSTSISKITSSRFGSGDAMQICPDCKDMQSVMIRQCTNCKEPLPFCAICKRGFANTDQKLVCPHCDNIYHRAHLFAYIQSKGECAVCKEGLTLGQFS